MPKVFQPNEIGISRFIIDISGALAGFASIGVMFSISRFFPKFKTKSNSYHNGFTFWVYTVPFFGILILSVLLLFFGPSILNLLKDGGSKTTEYIYIIIPLTIIMLYTLVTEQYCAQFGRIVVVNVVRENGLRLINLILLVLVWNSFISFNQFVFWLLVSYATVLVVDIIYLSSINYLSLVPDFDFIKKNKSIRNDFLKFTSINLIGSIGPMLMARSDYFSASIVGGDNALGIYSMAFSIAIMAELPKRVILPIIQPLISGLIHDKKLSELRTVVSKGSLNQVLIGMAILLIIWFNADSIFSIMPNGHKYESGKIIILILGTAKLIELYSVLAGIVLNNSHFYRWNLFVIAMCLTGMFTVYYFVVPIWGIVGTALGVMMSYIAYAVVNFIVVYKYYKIHWLEIEWLKIALLFVAMLLINHFLPYFGNIWLNIFVRSGLLMTLFAGLVFGMKLSKDLNKTAVELWKGNFRWF